MRNLATTFLIGFFFLLGCSDSRPAYTRPAPQADTGPFDAAGEAEPEDVYVPDPDDCATCSEYVDPAIRATGRTVCRHNGNGSPSSITLFNTLTDCTCQQACNVECTQTCQGSTEAECLPCVLTKCADLYNACTADIPKPK